MKTSTAGDWEAAGSASRKPGLQVAGVQDRAAAEGSSPYFAVFEADFPDADAMGRALASSTGAALQAEMPSYATGGAVVLHYPVTGSSGN